MIRTVRAEMNDRIDCSVGNCRAASPTHSNLLVRVTTVEIRKEMGMEVSVKVYSGFIANPPSCYLLRSYV